MYVDIYLLGDKTKAESYLRGSGRGSLVRPFTQRKGRRPDRPFHFAP